MGIGGTHDGCLHKTIVLIDTHEGFYYEGDKAQVAQIVFTWSVEQDACVCSERPVVVLSRTIDAVERLFVEQATETVLASHLLHQRHNKHIMVNSEVALFIDWCQLKLVWGYFVMACLTRDTQFESLYLKVFHEFSNTLWYSSKIMVIHLLVFC